MKVNIRDLREDDAVFFEYAFNCQGWYKPASLFQKYFAEQKLGTRMIFVAEFEGELLGYVTLKLADRTGPFRGKNIPELADFNILKAYQNHGFGTALMDAAEDEARKRYDYIGLAVGLHSGYGNAQRMYCKRGYVLDGSGIWHDNRRLMEMEKTTVDDDLVLYMVKELKLSQYN